MDDSIKNKEIKNLALFKQRLNVMINLSRARPDDPEIKNVISDMNDIYEKNKVLIDSCEELYKYEKGDKTEFE